MSDEIKACLRQLGLERSIDFESDTFKVVLEEAKTLAPTIEKLLGGEGGTDKKAEAVVAALSGSTFNTAALRVQSQAKEASTKIAIANSVVNSMTGKKA